MRRITRFAAILVVVGCPSMSNAAEIVITTSWAGISSAGAIVIPIGYSSVVKAVNVGSTSTSSVNGILFEGDTVASTESGLHSYTGNGYTAMAGYQPMSPLTDATFTASAVAPPTQEM
ncbi:MAG: hypothetical protein NTX45_21280 [Proteobacteria bacterium]|nr:hypothetical protein [Pseudomonadota bacterium]